MAETVEIKVSAADLPRVKEQFASMVEELKLLDNENHRLRDLLRRVNEAGVQWELGDELTDDIAAAIE